ncbi:TPA: hypothetical protein NIB55_005873 [Pseudomonas aeruginosa]|nr:hypothetical protein [Pseudomonas aeruginosa]
MLTPDEARRLGGKHTSAKQTVLDHVAAKIRKGAEQGAVSVFVPVNYGFNPAAFEEAMAELKSLGYGLTEEEFDHRPHIRIWW